MRLLLLIGCAAFFQMNLHRGGALSIFVEGSKAQNGIVHVSICGTPEDYSKDKAGEHYQFPMENGFAKLDLGELRADRYAFKLFVDLNGNGIMDMNLFGIPKEPYAFSNNAMGTFGPPGFDQASFLIDQNKATAQRIKLRGE